MSRKLLGGRTAAVLCMLMVVAESRAAGQTPGDSRPAGAMPAGEVATLARGWTALSNGDLAAADLAADEAIRQSPRDGAALALGVEAALARGGWRAGLDLYESWLSSRSVEDFYALRRVARSVLFDALNPTTLMALRVDAANALAPEEGAAVVAALQADAQAGAAPNSLLLAAAGDSGAVARAADDIRAGRVDPLSAIAALSDSGNEAAAPALVQSLSSPRPEVRAAAARGLGRLGDWDAIPQLRRQLQDPQLVPRIAAVESLMRMGDSSGQSLLQTWLTSDVPDVRLKALQASASRADATWIAAVRQLLQEADPLIRIGAARLLADHEPSTARWALQQLANDTNPAVREAAAQALPEVIGGDFGELRRFLRSGNPVTRVRAAVRIFELTR